MKKVKFRGQIRQVVKESAGEYKYTSILGQSITIPCVKAVYMEITE